MGELGAFLKLDRVENPERDPRERIHDYHEFLRTLAGAELAEQGARCMECGVPFCHDGCPVNNLIPDWNDLVYRDRWQEAIEQLHRTNNFPDFTGRLCPAPCEAACVLEIREGEAVTIKQIELAIINRAWEEGWVRPRRSEVRTGRTVAVIGSGPSGLACAQELARAGHSVTVYERDEAGGGLVRFGVPDFKIEKQVVERRIEQLAAEGVEFRFGVDVGVDLPVEELRAGHEAVVVATGSRVPRDLPVPGRELAGVHFAMEYLYGRNRWVARELGPRVTGAPPAPADGAAISAAGKHVIVIGGGDTGSDCVGTSIRQGAKSVTQFELLPQPPEQEDKDLTWPYWPVKLRTSSSQEEGCDRDWAVATKRFEGRNGRVEKLVAARVEWRKDGSGAQKMVEIEGSEFEIKADLVLLAMGFVGPVREGMLQQLGVAHDPRGNVRADTEDYQTSVPKVFAAGDMRRGQSLVVWAIREGRQCARAVDLFLMGSTELPR